MINMHQPMCVWIEDIKLQDLRCHHHVSWKLHKHLNLFVGDNGCGKTTILEAVYLMAHGRSFRQARDPELVAYKKPSMHIKGTWHRYGPLHVQVRGKRRKTELLLQGRKLSKRSELTDILSVIVDAPQMKRLIDGVSHDRRKWLDQLMLFCHPSIHPHYQAYLRALMQRSRVLRQSLRADELEVWEIQMVQHGRYIKQARAQVCEELNQALSQELKLTERLLVLDMSSQVPDQDDVWLSLLSEKRESDKRMGRCSVGPHSDKLNIHFVDKEIRAVGSRGQQKLSSIALRLAECALRHNYRSMWPVLLLDDCFEALDQTRRLQLMQRLSVYEGQMLLTAPDKQGIPQDLVDQVWDIHSEHGETVKTE
ncbi:MAG: DNA replication and repair protein RecF [Mariprofundaceae bacterium]